MKAVIVNCFDTYEDRIDLLHDFFMNEGFDTTVVQSDFKHFKKIKRTEPKKDFIFIKSKPYYKNMSLPRIASHYNFAKHAFQLVENLKPDLLYVIVPPNSLAKFAGKYKIKHGKVKILFDLIDLWPETMPVGKIKMLPPFKFWGSMRDKNLKYADCVITECDLYREVLKKQLKGIKTETVYLAKREVNINRYPIFNEDKIQLCYLGSINSIIDIPKIKEIVESINEIKPVIIHIIGDGERKNVLIEELKSTGAIIEYHGKIYDTQKKQEIFDKCQFGLNIMKNTVCVGLTMKSMDYFQAGLPIINTIQADTARIIDENKIGINITNKNISDVVNEITNFEKEELLVMRENTYNLFRRVFSVEAFNKKMKNIIETL